MSLFHRLINRLRGAPPAHQPPITPAQAYDLWAATYDDQPGNLMFHLDNIIFSRLLGQAALENKIVVDIGCGTGRHWGEMLAQRPAALSGYDVSAEMLNQLNHKHPGAQTFLLRDNALRETPDAACDVLISTLALGYIENLAEALAEWNRVLKPGGRAVLTDYHPAALEKGANRAFRQGNRMISIKNQIHGIGEVRQLLDQMGWREMEFIELPVDETVRHFYEEQKALHVYQRFYRVPIIYGWHLKKA